MTQSGLTMTDTHICHSTDAPPPLHKKLASWPQSFPSRPNGPKRVFEIHPQPSQERLDATQADQPFDSETLASALASGVEGREKARTVLYLAYGSNLCNETFRGVRGIRPLSQVNVLVPSLRLTFDLPGIPYSEPCFANSARRTPGDGRARSSEEMGEEDYHKNRWRKGLVGVVYEVTRSDYAHIIATEGGGSAYHDILVDCYVLPASDTVPSTPTSQPFRAHTLFAPVLDDEESDRVHRPDPSYAQPSARYLKLITDGATECQLPAEYQDYLHDIRPYTITSKKQAAGKALFLAIWMPFVVFIFTLSRKLQDKKGRAPWWIAKLSAMIFAGMWMSYDGAFKAMFGDGERTVGDEALWKKGRESLHNEPVSKAYVEKETLLKRAVDVIHGQCRKTSCDDGRQGNLV